MGSGFSTKLLSEDGVWGSVSLWDNECKKNPGGVGKDNWYLVSPELLDGLDDSDMEKIVDIFAAKKSIDDKRRDEWTINHDVIRIIDITWDKKERAYSYLVSIKMVVPNNDPIIKKVDYPTYRMYRLAFHLDALADYKKMKLGESDGALFEKISKELEQFRVAF